MSELSRRESAAVWLVAIPIWAVVLVLLYTHSFHVVRAAQDPLFWLVIAAQVWWHRFAVRDLRRWSANPSHEDPRRQQG